MENRTLVLLTGVVPLILLATLGGEKSATATQGESLGALTVDRLGCEYRADPLGVDVVAPRLSWILESNQRGVMQGAYQILVASSEKILKENQGDLWDSGRVDKDRRKQIVCVGDALKSICPLFIRRRQ
ncbi:MAG: hypothetical protein GY809_21050 [Planctomycetes bacterium]|nr:hypothetical protein [Planctomycetota bacterium]